MLKITSAVVMVRQLVSKRVVVTAAKLAIKNNNNDVTRF
jgi:hypothetical protein